MSYPYKIMTYDPVDVGWEDDSFAEGWTAYYCGLIRDGDIAELTVNIGYVGGWIQKDGLNIDAATYKYCVFCVKGTGRFFVEVYDGAWKSVTNGHEPAPSEYDVKVYDLSTITTGTITNIRLGVGDSELKVAYYDFIAFCNYQPLFATDKVISLHVRQRESDIDEFELIGEHDIGSSLTIGRHVRIWLNGVGGSQKVFAGIIEEATPADLEGRVYHVSGRCFGVKLLLRTKSKNFSGREVSLAVKDFVEDLSEVTTFHVETPSPSVFVTKDYRYEYIIDGLKDLAKIAGEDWEVKLGMGHDLRFRSRQSSNVPSAPFLISEGYHILRGTTKQTDGFRTFNKVTVLGGSMCNFTGDSDEYTDEGDISNYTWQVFGSDCYIEEDPENVAYGTRSIHPYYLNYNNTMTIEFDLGSGGRNLTHFREARFMHKTGEMYGIYGIQCYPQEGTTFYFRLLFKDTAYRNAYKTYLPDSTQPPSEFAEVVISLEEGWTEDSGFDWQHVRWVQFQCVSNRTNSGEGVLGHYWIDNFHFYTPNITKTASDSLSGFRHVREYVLRDEKLVDPDFVQEVADALLAVLKNQENRFRVPLLGMPCIQVGYKVTIDSPTNGLNGTYYIVEAEHKITARDGYLTEMVLERPRLYLERLLAEVIERKIKRIERGGIT